MTAAFLHHSPRRRLLGTAVLGLCACVLAGCNEPGGPSLGTMANADNMPQLDLTARGPVPKSNYGTVSGGSGARAEVFAGSPLPASVSAFAASSAAPTGTAAASTGDSDRVLTADADIGVVPGGGGFQLNFENADVGAVAKAVLGDILKSNYLVDRRVTGQITLTSAQPVPRARLVPLLETALAGLGATVVKDQDLYRVVPSSDTGGMASVGGRDVGEGFGTSVITARYMPAANLAHLLEGFRRQAGGDQVRCRHEPRDHPGHRHRPPRRDRCRQSRRRRLAALEVGCDPAGREFGSRHHDRRTEPHPRQR